MIKGIDSQIITSRTTDFMKDNSARLKGDEFNQALSSKLEKNDVEKQTKTVTDVNKSEIRKVDEHEDEKKKKDKRHSKDKKKDLGEVVIQNQRVNNDTNAVSGNESVGYTRPGGLDIEI